MTAVDERINSKKSAAQQAEDIKQAATSTAEETRQNIGSIEALVKQTAKQVKTIADLKNLESELQVSRKKVRLIIVLLITREFLLSFRSLPHTQCLISVSY